MKCLLLTEVFPPKTGGSGRWFWEIYRRLRRQDIVIAAGEDPRQSAFDRTHNLALTRVPLEMSNWGLRSRAGLRGYWRGYRAVRRILKAHPVESIHCARCLPEGWIAWLLSRRCNIRYMCYVHGEEANYAESSRELTWMMRRVLGGADFLIANSRNTREILLGQWGIPGEKVRLLYPGVDTARFVPAAPSDLARAQLGWLGRRVVLTVGRLQKRKGHDQMIRALHGIHPCVPNVLYSIVGDGDERAALEQLVQAEGLGAHVQFRGEPSDDDLIRCYQQCDLFVLPNRQVGRDIEGFGMVLLEAQACGKPVVAGASGGTAETMNVPDTGCVVGCDGPELLAATVVDLLLDSARRSAMSRAARDWVVRHFDWGSLSREAAELFHCELAPAQISTVGADLMSGAFNSAANQLAVNDI